MSHLSNCLLVPQRTVDQANGKNTDTQNPACSVILNMWVPPESLKTKELSIYLFLRHVVVESRTCFWSSSICFCCKCHSAVVCVSCKKPQKNVTSEILSES